MQCKTSTTTKAEITIYRKKTKENKVVFILREAIHERHVSEADKEKGGGSWTYIGISFKEKRKRSCREKQPSF